MGLDSWVDPTPRELALLIGTGLFGGAGQYALVSAYARAPATIVAPFDYCQLIWATALGFAIWGEAPAADVATLEGRIAELTDRLLRAHAEMDNLRKRSAKVANSRLYKKCGDNTLLAVQTGANDLQQLIYSIRQEQALSEQ